MGIGTRAEPFTVSDAAADRRFKWCKCCDCGAVHQCTPDFDFWFPCNTDFDFNEVGPAKLLCDPCHDSWVNKVLKMPVLDIRPKQRQSLEGTQN